MTLNLAVPADNAPPNRWTLAALLNVPTLPASVTTEELALLTDEFAAAKEALGKAGDAIHAACEAKFGEKAKAARVAEGKDSGTERLEDGDWIVVTNAPKRVEWLQSKLKVIYDKIVASGERPEEYIKAEYKVAERSYEAWPESIRKQFEPARTLKLGKTTYSFEPKKS